MRRQGHGVQAWFNSRLEAQADDEAAEGLVSVPEETGKGGSPAGQPGIPQEMPAVGPAGPAVACWPAWNTVRVIGKARQMRSSLDKTAGLLRGTVRGYRLACPASNLCMAQVIFAWPK